MSLFSITIGSTTPAPQTWLATVLPGVTVALIAGIVLFLLNWGREYLTAQWKKESEAEVLAFSLVTQFDKLISQCADVVDDELHQDRETQCWEATVRTPEISFAESTVWSVFSKSLQYKIRSIPNKIDVANRNIGSLWEYGDGPPDFSDAFQERCWRYAWIGLEACLINDTLADKYGVPALERGDWDPQERFKREIAKIDKRRNDEKQNPWPLPDWMSPAVPIEDLQDRHAKLRTDLDVAKKRQTVR